MTILLNLKKILIKILNIIGHLKFLNIFFLKSKNNLSIIYMHRVVKKEGLIPEIEINVSSLKQNLVFLKKYTNIISLDDLVLSKKMFNENNTYSILTFDDGYKDNLKILFPTIKRLKVPIIIYLTTRFLQGDTWMWWYHISEYLQNSVQTNFTFERKKYSFVHNNSDNKNYFFNKIKSLLDPLDIVDQKKLCTLITKIKPKNYDKICLNWEDVQYLSKSNLVLIGCHSHSHLNLKLLSNSQLDYEIGYSKEILNKKLKKRIDHFAFPYGSKKEVNLKVIRKVRNLGFKTAVTTEKFDNNFKDFFLLNRFSIGSEVTPARLNNKIFGLENFVKKYIYK